MFTINATQLYRFMNCNGSRQMPSELPMLEGDITQREEGTAAHHMAQTAFEGTIKLEQLIDLKAPNNYFMTDEMAGYVEQYLSALDCGEMEIDTSYGNDHYRVNGRVDHIKYRDDTNTLTVDDFKYGYGIIEPFENWTLISHAVGYLAARQLTPQTLIFRIHQPRPYHPDGKLRDWSISWNEFLGYQDRIVNAMLEPSDTLHTGNHCRKCHAITNCPAARKAGLNGVDVADGIFNDEIDNATLAGELDLLETADARIKNRLDALRNLAIHRLTSGAVIDNRALEHQYGHTAWHKHVTPEILKVITGVDLSKPGLVTPAEAKRRGVIEAVIKPLTHRPMTGTKLIRVDAAKRAEKLLGKA